MVGRSNFDGNDTMTDTKQTSGYALWLERVIDAAQKEVDTWDSWKRESMEREAERTYYPDVKTEKETRR